MAAGKKTGGRTKGTPNKLTVQLQAEIAASGETPKDYMLRVMRDPTVDHARRDAMAKAVAPFCHPHLQAVQHTGKDGGPIELVTKGQRDAAVAAALRADA